MATLISGPFQPFLEDRFLDQLSKIKKEDPFVPITIMAPTGTLLKKLTKFITKASTDDRESAWVNIHFFTFYTFSENILRSFGINLPEPTTRAAMSLLLKEVLTKGADEDRDISRLLKYDSYIDRLIRLFSQFISYKVSEETKLKGIEKTILSLFLRFYAEKRRREKEGDSLDREEIIRLASLNIGDINTNPLLKNVFLYGFYDLNPLQRDILSALNEKGNLFIFSPLIGDESFAKYAGSTLKFFRSLTDGAGGEIVYDETENVNRFAAVSSLLFAKGDGPAIDIGGSSDSPPKNRIRVVTSSGEMGEVKSVALEILRTKEERPEMKWREIGVTMRDLSAQRENLRSVFDRYSIPAHFEGGTPLKSYIEVRTFLNLLSVLTTKLKRKDLSTLLFSDHFSWPGILEGELKWVRDNSHLVEIIARDAGIVYGAKGWRDAWKGNGSQIVIDEYIDDDESSQISKRERLSDMERFKSLTKETILGLIDDITDIPDSSTPEDYSKTMMELLLKYILPSTDDSTPYDALKSVGSFMARLTGSDPGPDGSGVNISLIDFISLLDREIAEMGINSNADADAVFVSSVMGIRGLSFKTTIIMGLNEKIFPRILHSDPLISEQTREYLGLPTARGRFEEEKLLFALAVRSAGERLILSYQRSDDSGRKSIYSTFLRELLLKVETNGRNWHEIYEEGGELPDGSAVRYPRLFQAEGKHSKYTEKDIRMSTALLSDSVPVDDVRGVVSQSNFLRDGLVSINARAIDKAFSIHDGVIGKADDMLERLLPMSAGKLETYAGCPFRFFMKYVIDVAVTEEPTEDEDIDAKEIGTLYHNTLAQLFKTLKEKKLFPLTEDNSAIASEHLKTIVTEIVNKRLSGRIPKLVVRARREVVVEKLDELIKRELENIDSLFIPTLFEASFGGKTHDRTEPHPPLVVRLNDRDIEFSGRIDRIDVNEAEEAFQVIDYKKKRSSSHIKVSTQIGKGSHFQIPIYLLAARESILGNRFSPEGGRLLFIEYEKKSDRMDIVGGELESIFDTMKKNVSKEIASIEGGIFYPKTSDFCKFCSYKDICRYVTKGTNKIRIQKTEE